MTRVFLMSRFQSEIVTPYSVLCGKTAMKLGSETQDESEMKEAMETLYLCSEIRHYFIGMLKYWQLSYERCKSARAHNGPEGDG